MLTTVGANDDRALAAAAQSYLLESAPIVALQLDANQSVVATNAWARTTLGDDIVGQPFAQLLVNGGVTSDLSTFLADTSASHRLTVNTISGQPESLRFRFYPLATGTLLLGSVDVHEQARLGGTLLAINRELNDLSRVLHQANAELRELNALKTLFVGMAAHDLRGPIGVILTHVELVLDDAGDLLSDQSRRLLRTCLSSAMGMKRLVDNFLDLAIIDSGHLRLTPTATTGDEILADVLPIARLAASRREVELVVDKPAGGCSLRADAGLLSQVLVNLVSNAVDHSLVGGCVTLALRCTPETVTFRVSDTGPGIPPDVRAGLFDAFTRRGARIRAGERRAGLGLAIAREVVEAHGGRISVESEVGHGTTFVVELPTTGPAPD